MHPYLHFTASETDNYRDVVTFPLHGNKQIVNGQTVAVTAISVATMHG